MAFELPAAHEVEWIENTPLFPMTLVARWLDLSTRELGQVLARHPSLKPLGHRNLLGPLGVLSLACLVRERIPLSAILDATDLVAEHLRGDLASRMYSAPSRIDNPVLDGLKQALLLPRSTRGKFIEALAKQHGIARATIYRRFAEVRDGKSFQDGRKIGSQSRRMASKYGSVWSKIEELLALRVPVTEIAHQCGVCTNTVYRCRRRLQASRVVR